MLVTLCEGITSQGQEDQPFLLKSFFTEIVQECYESHWPLLKCPHPDGCLERHQFPLLKTFALHAQCCVHHSLCQVCLPHMVGITES